MPKAFKAKKLVLVLETSALVTSASKEVQVIQVTQERKKVILDQILCIHHPVQFPKNKVVIIQALIDFGNEVNAMTPAYAKKLGLWT